MSLPESASQPAKRKRVSLACSSCKSRKIKCERVYPCEACIKRGDAEHCRPEQPFDSKGVYHADVRRQPTDRSIEEDSPPSDQQQQQQQIGQPASNGDELTALKMRVATLEQFLITRMPDASAAIQSAQGASGSGATKSSKTLHFKPDEESEDAAMVLEDLALGQTINYPFTSSTKRHNSTPSSGGSPVHSANQLYPSIATCPTYSSFNRQVVDLILRRIPSDQDVRHLTALYWRELAWSWCVLCETQFATEAEEFFRLRRSGIAHHADPAWLALLLIILTLAMTAQLDTVAGSMSQNGTDQEAGLQEYYDASRMAVELAGGNTKPQIRVMQTLMLFINHITLLPNSRKDGGNANNEPYIDKGLAMAKQLKLDRLHESPTAMPAPDAAFAERPSLLARQVGARLWSCVSFLECMRGAKDGDAAGLHEKGIGWTRPEPPIGNYHDHDLSWDLTLAERPLTEHTSSIIELLKMRISRTAAKLASARTAGFTHDTVMEFDQEIRALLDHSVKSLTPEMDLRVKMMENAVHHQILRLHRPFLLKGLKSLKYRASYDIAIDSAVALANNFCLFTRMSNIMSRFWWLSVHGVGAVLVLATALLAQVEKPPTDPVIISYRSHLELTVTCMETVQLRSSKEAVKSVTAYIVRLGKRLLDVEREKRGQFGRKGQPVAQVFADVAKYLQDPSSASTPSSAQQNQPAFVGSSSASSLSAQASPQSTEDWLASLDWLAPLSDPSLTADATNDMTFNPGAFTMNMDWVSGLNGTM